MGLGSAKLKYTIFLADQIPEGRIPRWVVLGRSNVGKSSFLNALIHPLTLFKTSSTPGKTRGVIGVEVQVAKPASARLEIVDLPGFGFAHNVKNEERDLWSQFSEALRDRSHDAGLQWIWLADPTRQPEDEERQLLEWIGNQPFTFIFTKADQVKPVKRRACEDAWARVSRFATEGPYWSSSLKGEGMDVIIKSARSWVRSRVEG